MHTIDWLHSPGLTSSMDRFIKKYLRFFAIMRRYRSKVAVPTLCIDLVWHTHQLNPLSYYTFSDATTNMLIDHDDKIEEAKLSEAFAWTSKVYQQRFGELYSECTCWYCEAVRESHTSSLDSFFRPKKHQALEVLQVQSFQSDPEKSPHVSTHNVVRDRNVTAAAKKRALTAALLIHYNHAAERAKKKDRREPPKMEGLACPTFIDEGNPKRDVFVTDPHTVDSTAGVAGNCAAGSCGGMAGFGGTACSGSGAGCAGGSGGASGGCGGGGGGGGGCGGGGGG